MKWKIAKKHQDMMVKDYLIVEQGFSRRLIKAIKYQGLYVNGERCTVRRKLHPEDVLEVLLPPENKGTFMKPENLPLDIVYEDNEVLVINKPAGIATIPSVHHESGTIANRVLGYYQTQNIKFTIHIVTRLDRDTSGLLLVAKHRFSHLILSQAQKQGAVSRSYYAITEGKLSDSYGTINAPIGRKEGSIIERIVSENGQQAITHYRVIEETDEHSLLEVNLETGRTHQIRVHFSYLGHPLMGDDLYGGHMTRIKRQALHCKSLVFHHPITKQYLEFNLPIPEDMKRILS